MPRLAVSRYVSWAAWFGALVGMVGCQTTPGRDNADGARRSPPVRNARLVKDVAEIPKIDGPEPTEPIGPVTATQPASPESIAIIEQQVPTPERAIDVERKAMGEAEKSMDRAFHEAIIERVNSIHRARQTKLTLEDCINRTLLYDYGIRAVGYTPAVETTKIVEAEAAFDATFYANGTFNRQDRPSGSQLQGTLTDTRSFESGVKKLLASGMQVSASYAMTRTFTDLIFQTLNPQYFSQFAVRFRQPLLRNFGIDFNRSQIELSKLDRRTSVEEFSRTVQETLYSVEQAYWALKRARLDLVVSARLLADFERIDQFFASRAGFDTYPIQRGQVGSRLETRRAEFVQLRANVFNAEDNLKALMNDPTLNFAKDIEIVPADEFVMTPVVIDRLGEVQAALDNRPELKEAQLDIEKARVGLGVAKNQALPKFDLIFQYAVDGLAGSGGNSFDQVTQNNYHEYYVGLEFEWPIGNRGPEAGVRRARLAQSQAVAQYAAQIEKIINEVHQAIRDMQVAYDQISSGVLAVDATAKEVRATRDRQLARDPANLEVELNALERLAGTRNNLNAILTNYNVAAIQLELRKGTLLQYNNIELRNPDTGEVVTASRAVNSTTLEPAQP